MNASQHDMPDMMHTQFQNALWTQFANIILGLWLATSPVTFGYGGDMAWNDTVSGIALIMLGFLSLSYERGWARWATTALGIWLLMAPLVLWAPTAASYVNATIVGTLAIAFSILVPGMPGMRMQPGPETPPGWSYNPSSWLQRAPIIGIGMVGFFISRYLAAVQLGYIDEAWDPFFGNQTMNVLTSDMSEAWPVSDAGLGAVAYMLEALSGFMGHRDRWRTMPWMVLMFGFLVIPLGLVHIALVMSQPVLVGNWCTLCIAVALLMLLMIPLAVDEVVAMGQFIKTTRSQGKPFWTNFWKGGTPWTDEEIEAHMDSNGGHGSNGDDEPDFQSPLGEASRAMVWGVTVPWNLLLMAAAGIWITVAPGVLLYEGSMANSDHLAGPIIAVIAVTAMAEVTRSVRLLAIPVALWIMLSPLLLDGGTTASLVSNLIAGLLIIALSVPRGPIRQRYADWSTMMR